MSVYCAVFILLRDVSLRKITVHCWWFPLFLLRFSTCHLYEYIYVFWNTEMCAKNEPTAAKSHWLDTAIIVHCRRVHGRVSRIHISNQTHIRHSRIPHPTASHRLHSDQMQSAIPHCILYLYIYIYIYVCWVLFCYWLVKRGSQSRHQRQYAVEPRDAELDCYAAGCCVDNCTITFNKCVSCNV